MQDATTDTGIPNGDLKEAPGSCDTIAFAAKRSQDQFSRSKRQQQDNPFCSQGSGLTGSCSEREPCDEQGALTVDATSCFALIAK